MKSASGRIVEVTDAVIYSEQMYERGTGLVYTMDDRPFDVQLNSTPFGCYADVSLEDVKSFVSRYYADKYVWIEVSGFTLNPYSKDAWVKIDGKQVTERTLVKFGRALQISGKSVPDYLVRDFLSGSLSKYYLDGKPVKSPFLSSIWHNFYIATLTPEEKRMRWVDYVQRASEEAYKRWNQLRDEYQKVLGDCYQKAEKKKEACLMGCSSLRDEEAIRRCRDSCEQSYQWERGMCNLTYSPLESQVRLQWEMYDALRASTYSPNWVAEVPQSYIKLGKAIRILRRPDEDEARAVEEATRLVAGGYLSDRDPNVLANPDYIETVDKFFCRGRAGGTPTSPVLVDVPVYVMRVKSVPQIRVYDVQAKRWLSQEEVKGLIVRLFEGLGGDGRGNPVVVTFMDRKPAEQEKASICQRYGMQYGAGAGGPQNPVGSSDLTVELSLCFHSVNSQGVGYGACPGSGYYVASAVGGLLTLTPTQPDKANVFVACSNFTCTWQPLGNMDERRLASMLLGSDFLYKVKISGVLYFPESPAYLKPVVNGSDSGSAV
ncbi:MAG: hypothetical protein ACPL3C_10540, partial [Pyrobaculum sp.]